LFIAIFYAKYTNLKNIVRCHSTGLVQSKLGTFSPDRRLSRPNPDPQGLPCLTCVQPNLTYPIHSPGIQSLDGYWCWDELFKNVEIHFLQCQDYQLRPCGDILS
jgi:hypothetical protein